FRDVKNRTCSHFFGIFFEPIFPIFLRKELIAGEEYKELLNVATFDNFSKPDVPCVGGRNHYQDIVATYPQEVESFKLPRYQAIRDFLNDAYPVIGVNNLIAYLKCVHIPPENSNILCVPPITVKGILSVKPRPTRFSAYLVENHEQNINCSCMCHW